MLKYAIHNVWGFSVYLSSPTPTTQNFMSIAYFCVQLIKASLVLIACKMPELFALFEGSTQLEQTIVHQVRRRPLDNLLFTKEAYTSMPTF